MAGLKTKANLTQALVAGWATGNGKSENRNHIQTFSLVKSICVLIHINLGNHCLSLFSGFTVVTHLDSKSAMGLCFPGTWIIMTSMFKMAVISQTFLAQVGKKRVFSFANIQYFNTKAWLSQNILTFLFSQS